MLDIKHTKSDGSINSLTIEIDSKLCVDKHISKLSIFYLLLAYFDLLSSNLLDFPESLESLESRKVILQFSEVR